MSEESTRTRLRTDSGPPTRRVSTRRDVAILATDHLPVTGGYIVAPYGAGMRLDAYLCRYLGTHSRSEWQRLVEEGSLTLNAAHAKPATRLFGGEHIEVHQRPARPVLDPDPTVAFDVVYVDEAMVVVDKPSGLVVHPAPGHAAGTLVHGLLARFPELRDPTGQMRPGIVHRLDKDTSGLLVVGRTVDAVAALQREMQAGRVTKKYRLLVLGQIQEDHGIIDVPIARDRVNRQKMAARADGRASRSEFRVIERFDTYTYLEAGLPSGRTHQLRVHFSYIGHPVAGDRTYGNGRAPAELDRQFVHSHELTLRSPADGIERTFRSELPADLAGALASLQPNKMPVSSTYAGAEPNLNEGPSGLLPRSSPPSSIESVGSPS